MKEVIKHMKQRVEEVKNVGNRKWNNCKLKKMESERKEN